MRILHVLTAPRAEGTPRLALDWLDIDVEQHVCFLQSTPDTLLSTFQTKAASVVINPNQFRGYVKFFSIIRLIYKVCKKINPDVVLVYPTGVSQYAHIGARLAGVKRLLTHAGNPPSTNGFLKRYIFSYMTFWTSWLLGVKVIACSEYVKQTFQNILGVPKGIFYYVHNSFYPEHFIRQNSNGVASRAVMAATMEGHKDHKTLLYAWRYVEDKHREAQLTMAGDGSLKETILELSRSLDLQHVHFPGYVNDMPVLLHQSNVFVFSTTPSEGFGTVLLEALAAGLKVVASDVPACREVLQDGKYGVLVPPNDPKSLADAILEAFKHPLSESQRQSQIEYTRRFTPENMMRQYLEIAGFGEEAKRIVKEKVAGKGSIR